MYSMSSGSYSCDWCGHESAWDGHDEDHGDMWECEKCGRHFYTRCFVSRIGTKALMKCSKATRFCARSVPQNRGNTATREALWGLLFLPIPIHPRAEKSPNKRVYGLAMPVNS